MIYYYSLFILPLDLVFTPVVLDTSIKVFNHVVGKVNLNTVMNSLHAFAF